MYIYIWFPFPKILKSLLLLQSLTLKSKDSAGKYKERGEDFAHQKNLLLWMVRLIHADPMLMLNVGIILKTIPKLRDLAVLYYLLNNNCFSVVQNQGKAGHEIQSSTLELINGLVSLVHQPTMPDVAQEAMEALLVLHHPEKIEVWNPEAPINTFWDVRLVILFKIGPLIHCFIQLRCWPLFIKWYSTFYFQFSSTVFYFTKIDSASNYELH